MNSTNGELLSRLGARVRARRQALAYTLRELAERASVSERFLVLLEGGRGNVSVSKLADIAAALGTTPADLLAENAALPGTPLAPKRRIVALLGLRGAGKTTVGTRAAARLELPFIELDARVVARAGMSLGELFELHGPSYYRTLERAELERVVEQGAPAILGTGGGVVTEPATYELLKRACVTVWLKATADDHWNRVVAQGDARPMANRSYAMKELRALVRGRRALYEQADHVVDTSRLGLSRSVERVVKIARRG